MSERGELLRQVVLQVIRQCPQCQQPFAAKDVRLLGRMDETWLFSLYCRSCHTLAIVGLSLTPTAELAHEKEPEQARARPVTVDDVLDMHLFLQNLRDFEILEQDRQSPPEPDRQS